MKNIQQRFKYLKTFTREIKRLKKTDPKVEFLRSFLWFYPWMQSNLSGSSPLEDEIPWITFAAADFLKNYVREGMNVFEYGTGGSTLFFLNRDAIVFSVEHDEMWAKKVFQKLPNGCKNWIFSLRKPEPILDFLNRDYSDPTDFISSSIKYTGLSFEKYANEIKLYPDNFFDIILVDGRARPSCFIASLPKVKEGGIIVWDNTDRQSYWKTMEMAPLQLKFIDFPGPSPYVDFFTRTSVWLNPSRPFRQ